LIEGRYHEIHGHQNFTYSLIATFEESLEMAGIILIYALMQYIVDYCPGVRIEFGNSEEKACPETSKDQPDL
jgi:hypothetical protein